MPDEIKHYGTPRHSGRYPWGSGENPQRSRDFLSYASDLRKQGMTDTQIAKAMGISTTEFRARRGIAVMEAREASRTEAMRLHDKGMSNSAIGRQMGINESSVRNLLNPEVKERTTIAQSTAEQLKSAVSKDRYLDVGIGVERYMGVSRTRMNVALAMLKEQGYDIKTVYIEQAGNPSNRTTQQVLVPPGVDFKEFITHKERIGQIMSYSEDGGRTFNAIKPPVSVSSKRISVRFKEDGGEDKDGVIELRRGVNDLSLGDKHYAQVRIAVDGSHYLKGMAIYGEDIPKGYDIVFNTNKSKGTPMLGPKDNTVLKLMSDDPDLPFGAIIRQKLGPDGKQSALNIVGYKDESGEEGAWGKWSRTLSSQMLSKQTPDLAKRQLDLAFKSKQEEFDEIMSLTNPAAKKILLESFADDCDSSSAQLKAAALPRQRTHVLLPLPGIKEGEVYAPNYRQGEKVVLIRFPHGGIFEIPELTVNKNYKPGKEIIGENAKDAIGIHPKVAKILSGADFDGDTVLVIPNPKGLGLKRSAPLEGLDDFDAKARYKGFPGMKRMTSEGTQQQMGQVSNLITDMTIKGANNDEILRAVRHSMVVIDAEKHNLNYKQSFIDNGIAELKTKYQGGPTRGASTLISKAHADIRVPMRKERPYRDGGPIDPKTGKKVYVETGESYPKTKVYKDGSTSVRQITRLTKSKRAYEVEDLRELSSGTTMENVYATHGNRLKALANEARRAFINTPSVKQNPSAKKAFTEEIDSLNIKLDRALKNSPLERQAQLVATIKVAKIRAANPNIDKKELKKVQTDALNKARIEVGAKKERVDITDREWLAIQSGALSQNKVMQILSNTDLDRVKTLATPRTKATISGSTLSRAKAMLRRGVPQADIADALGVSISTILDLI